MGDKGELKGAGFSFAVSDTQKYGGLLVISVKSPAALKVGDAVQADVDEARRQRIRLNHSATHLMHAALRQCSAPMWRRKVRWSMIKRCALTSRILKR